MLLLPDGFDSSFQLIIDGKELFPIKENALFLMLDNYGVNCINN